MAAARQAMMDALDAFVPEYPQLIEQARKQLGKRFDIREYPNATSIRSHFDLSFDFQPVPSGTDFKGLPQQQLERLASHLNNNTRKMVENAMQDVWSRLHDAVSRMVDRLSSPDKVFHYTLIENVRETARLAKHLNVTEDKRVEAIRAKIERHLCTEGGEARTRCNLF
jgi:hypothetical protein